jgi:biotin operon repressor
MAFSKSIIRARDVKRMDRQRILAALTDQGQSLDEIAKATGLTRARVVQHSYFLAENPLVGVGIKKVRRPNIRARESVINVYWRKQSASAEPT